MKIFLFPTFVLSFISFLFITSAQAQGITEISRKLPPEGIRIPDAQRAETERSYNSLVQKLIGINHEQKADVDIYAKAVKFALLNGEFYKEEDFAKTLTLLKSAHKKAADLSQGKTPWVNSKGAHLRGFYSAIDDSPQPYGIEIPEHVDLSKKLPLYIWLHGRGDKTTDLHFMAGREKAEMKFPEESVISVYPLGRQCIGYKSAGETDVLEMIEHVKKNYNIDENRIALMGFSMGGAGAWHLGAHYAEKWAVVHPGAGFAETAEYNKMTKDKYPGWYTQKLWGLYDVPDYTRNLFNQPLIVYSGEVDKQKQAADVMEASFKDHGKSFPHILGPKMGHKYAPESWEEIVGFVNNAIENGRNPFADKVHLQTQTLRYSSMHWVQAHGLKEHWTDSRIDAEVKGTEIIISSKNISRLTITSPWKGKAMPAGTVIQIDIKTLTLAKESTEVFMVNNGEWVFADKSEIGLAKKPSLQGPMDDAFLSPFLVVTPSGNMDNTKLKTWLDFEIGHLKDRWRELFRGDIRIKADNQVTDEDIKKYHLIVWGTPASNSLLAKMTKRLPVKWKDGKIKVNDKTYDAAVHVPQFVYPNPLNGERYVVINSGPTFRENHDRTNSLQNPKQPDWSIIDIRQDPNGDAPGKIIDANFFDEEWNWKNRE